MISDIKSSIANIRELLSKQYYVNTKIYDELSSIEKSLDKLDFIHWHDYSKEQPSTSAEYLVLIEDKLLGKRFVQIAPFIVYNNINEQSMFFLTKGSADSTILAWADLPIMEIE